MLVLVQLQNYSLKMRYDRLRQWLSRHSVLSSAGDSHAMQLSNSVLNEGQALKQTQPVSLAGLGLLLQADSSSFITAFQAGLICTTAAPHSGQDCCAKTSTAHQADRSAFETRPRQRVSVAGAQSDLIKQLAAVFEGNTAASRRTSASDSLSRGSSIDIDAAVMVSVPSSKLPKASSVKALLQTWESLSTQQSSQLTRSSSSASTTSSSSSGSTGLTSRAPEPQRPCLRPLTSTAAAAAECTGSRQPR